MVRTMGGSERGRECEAADLFVEASVRRVQGFHLVLRILRGKGYLSFIC